MKGKALVVVAVLLGVVVVVLINQKFSSLEAKAERPTVDLYVATADVPPGITLRSALEGRSKYFRTVEVDEATARRLPDVLDTKGKVSYIDRPILRRIPSGEFLRAYHLAGVTPTEIQRRIPEGKFAISISVTQETSVSYLILPGDIVDVYTVHTVQDPEAPGGVRAVSERVVENVEVFAVDDVIMREDGVVMRPRGDAYSSVTIAGTEEQIRTLMEVRELGRLQLLLKSAAGTAR